MFRTVSYRQPRRFAWLMVLTLIGCTAQPVGPLAHADGITRAFFFTPDQDALISTSANDIVTVAEAATRLSSTDILQRRRTEQIRLDQLAYFFRSLDGQAYLLHDGQKAFVRGHPEAQCPAQSIVRGAAPTDTRSRGAIEQALQACHAQLATLGRDDICGCRILAHETILHAAPATFEYAVDLPVRLFRAGRLDPVTYFSRAGTDEAGNRALTIEVNGTRLMVISYATTTADQATVYFPDGTQAPAQRTPVGYDRGRLRESFTVQNDDGTTLRIIVSP